MNKVLLLWCYAVMVSISAFVEGISAQIIFEDEIQLPSQKSDEDLDYYEEIANGHVIQDTEKFRRQHGCLCLSHLKDPHCGSDSKIYDNGCYFECAQKRNPRLTLRNWGPCQ